MLGHTNFAWVFSTLVILQYALADPSDGVCTVQQAGGAEYTTIASALAACTNPGDTVSILDNAFYSESSLAFSGNTLTIEAADPMNPPTIFGADHTVGGLVVTFNSIHFTHDGVSAGPILSYTGPGTEVYTFSKCHFFGPGLVTPTNDLKYAIDANVEGQLVIDQCEGSVFVVAFNIVGNPTNAHTDLDFTDNTFVSVSKLLNVVDVNKVQVSGNTVTDCYTLGDSCAEIDMDGDSSFVSQELRWFNNIFDQTVTAGWVDCPPYATAYEIHGLRNPVLGDLQINNNTASGNYHVGLRLHDTTYAAVEKAFPAMWEVSLDDDLKLLREVGRLDNNLIKGIWTDIVGVPETDDPNAGDCTVPGCPCPGTIASSDLCDNLCPDPNYLGSVTDSNADLAFAQKTEFSVDEFNTFGGDALTLVSTQEIESAVLAGDETLFSADVTMEAYVEIVSPGPAAGEEQHIMTIEGSGADPVLQLYVENSKIKVRGSDTTSGLQEWPVAVDAATFTYDVDHHVAVTYSSTEEIVRVYMNGLPAAVVANAGFLEGTLADMGKLSVGGGVGPTTHTMVLDEVRFWSVQRTPFQIALYSSHALAAGTTGLEAYYTYDVNALVATDPELRDDSGDDRDLAAIVGTPATVTLGPSPATFATAFQFRFRTLYDPNKMIGGDVFPWDNARDQGSCSVLPVLDDAVSNAGTGPEWPAVWASGSEAIFSAANYLYPSHTWKTTTGWEGGEQYVEYSRFFTLSELRNCRVFGEVAPAGTEPVTQTISAGTERWSGRFYITGVAAATPAGDPLEVEIIENYSSYEYEFIYRENYGTIVSFTTSNFGFNAYTLDAQWDTGCTLDVCDVSLYFMTTVSHLDQQTPGQVTTYLSDATVVSQTGHVVDFVDATKDETDCELVDVEQNLLDDRVTSNTDLTAWDAGVTTTTKNSLFYISFPQNSVNTYEVTGLPKHSQIRLRGDLIVDGPFDGKTVGGDPHLVSIQVDGYGDVLLATFSNNPVTEQSYPATFDGFTTTVAVERATEALAVTGTYFDYYSLTLGEADFDTWDDPVADLTALGAISANAYTANHIVFDDPVADAPNFDEGVRVVHVKTGYVMGADAGTVGGSFDVVGEANTRDVNEEQHVDWAIYTYNPVDGLSKVRFGTFVTQNDGGGLSQLVSGFTAVSPFLATGDVYVTFNLDYVCLTTCVDTGNFVIDDQLQYSLEVETVLNAGQTGADVTGANWAVYSIDETFEHSFSTLTLNVQTINLPGGTSIGLDNLVLDIIYAVNGFCPEMWELRTGINANPSLPIDEDLTGTKDMEFTPYVWDPDTTSFVARGSTPLTASLVVDIERNFTSNPIEITFSANAGIFSDYDATNPNTVFVFGERAHFKVELDLDVAEKDVWAIEMSKINLCVAEVDTIVLDPNDLENSGCNTPNAGIVNKLAWDDDPGFVDTEGFVPHVESWQPLLDTHKHAGANFVHPSEAYFSFLVDPLVSNDKEVFLEIFFDVSLETEADTPQFGTLAPTKKIPQKVVASFNPSKHWVKRNNVVVDVTPVALAIEFEATCPESFVYDNVTVSCTCDGGIYREPNEDGPARCLTLSVDATENETLTTSVGFILAFIVIAGIIVFTVYMCTRSKKTYGELNAIHHKKQGKKKKKEDKDDKSPIRSNDSLTRVGQRNDPLVDAVRSVLAAGTPQV